MRRRDLLTGITAGVAGVAGCVETTNGRSPGASSGTTRSAAEATTERDTPTTTTGRCESTTTDAQFEDLWIRNDAGGARTVAVEVRTEAGQSVFDGSYAVEAGGEVRESTGIFTEREGTYTVDAVTGSGRNATLTVEVDAQGTAGSIVIVDVGETEVEVTRRYVNFTPTPVGPDC